MANFVSPFEIGLPKVSLPTLMTLLLMHYVRFSLTYIPTPKLDILYGRSLRICTCFKLVKPNYQIIGILYRNFFENFVLFYFFPTIYLGTFWLYLCLLNTKVDDFIYCHHAWRSHFYKLIEMTCPFFLYTKNKVIAFHFSC